MIVVAFVVASVWLVLPGGVALLRRFGAGRNACTAAAVAIYAGCCAAALAWLGVTVRGAAGCFGMGLPFAAALVVALRRPRAGNP